MSKTTSAAKALFPTKLMTTADGAQRSADEVLDCLYEVACGSVAPETYDVADRESAVKALRGMGAAGKSAAGRAQAAFAAKASAEPAEKGELAAAPVAAPPAKKARAKKAAEPTAPPPPPVADPAPEQGGLDFPSGEDEEPEAAPPVEQADGGREPAGGEPTAAGDEDEPQAASGEPISVKDGASAPAWRRSPAAILKAALRPLDPKFFDWDAAAEQIGVKGVTAARTLLANALAQAERVERSTKGGGKKAAGKVEKDALVRVRAKHAKTYDGLLDADETLKVVEVKGTYAHCVTKAGEGERATVPVAHLEVAPA